VTQNHGNSRKSRHTAS